MFCYHAKPLNLLIYYGYPNSFNSVTLGWNNEKVAQSMAQYNVIVLGNGVADPTHPDFANTQVIISRIKAFRPDSLVFGYVTTNQPLTTFQTKVDQWDNLHVNGIFMDEAGYDYGKTRQEFNDRVTYVKSKKSAYMCFPNAWNLDHILGLADDPSFPNSTFNPSLIQSSLHAEDIVLLESFSVNTTAYGSPGYASKSAWEARGRKAILLRTQYKVRLAAINIINDDNPDGQTLFNFAYNSALIWAADAVGSSSVYYGASTAQVKFWDRPSKSLGTSNTKNGPVVVNDPLDPNGYIRYGNYSKMILTYGSTPTSSIISW